MADLCLLYPICSRCSKQRGLLTWIRYDRVVLESLSSNRFLTLVLLVRAFHLVLCRHRSSNPPDDDHLQHANSQPYSAVDRTKAQYTRRFNLSGISSWCHKSLNLTCAAGTFNIRALTSVVLPFLVKKLTRYLNRASVVSSSSSSIEFGNTDISLAATLYTSKVRGTCRMDLQLLPICLVHVACI